MEEQHSIAGHSCTSAHHLLALPQRLFNTIAASGIIDCDQLTRIAVHLPLRLREQAGSNQLWIAATV